MSVYAHGKRQSMCRNMERERMSRCSEARTTLRASDNEHLETCTVCHGRGYRSRQTPTQAWQEDSGKTSASGSKHIQRLERDREHGDMPMTAQQKLRQHLRDSEEGDGADSAMLQSHWFLNMRMLKHVIPFIFFCGACGMVLSYMEQSNEEREIKHHKSTSVALRNAIELAVVEGRLDTSVLKMLDDVCALDLEPYNAVDLKWRFPGATFFVTTVVTTIGYGNYAPVTDAGKAFTCVMAVLGISWFGFILAIVSERIEALLIALWYRFRVCMKRPPGDGDMLSAFDMMIYTLVANTLYILLSAFLGWASGVISLGNAVYMSIITFTTVGLGDYCPPFFDAGRPLWYKSCAYLGAGLMSLFGLGLLASLLSSIEFWASRRVLSKVEMTALARSGSKFVTKASETIKRTFSRSETSKSAFNDSSAAAVLPYASKEGDVVLASEPKLMDVGDAKITGNTGQPSAHGQPSQGDDSLIGSTSSSGPT